MVNIGDRPVMRGCSSVFGRDKPTHVCVTRLLRK